MNLVPTISEMPAAISSAPPSVAEAQAAEGTERIALGEIVVCGGALSFQVLFERPPTEPKKLLANRFLHIREEWRRNAKEWQEYVAAVAAVAKTESELSAATVLNTTAKSQWLHDLETAGDFRESETIYTEAKGKAAVIEERLAVQREIVGKRKEAVNQAWRQVFQDALRREGQRIEAEVAALRKLIGKRLDGDVLDGMREFMGMAVALQLDKGALSQLVPAV